MIYLGADHAGYSLKEAVRRHLDERALDYEDIGTFSTESADYPDYAFAVADRVVAGQAEDRGILLCHTGIGTCIAANKVPGVLAALAYNVEVAQRARNDEDANVLCIGANETDETQALAIVDAFLDTPFSHAERHERRLGKISTRERRSGVSANRLREAVAARLKRLAADQTVRSLWNKDLSIWQADNETKARIADRLGWLGSAEAIAPEVEELRRFAKALASGGFTDAALLGMGGSSLAPFVFARVFGAAPGHLRLHVLDTTDPDMLSKIGRASCRERV